MEKIFARFLLVLTITFAVWQNAAQAQVSTPEIKNVSNDIIVSLPGNTGIVNITVDDYPFGIDIARLSLDTALLSGATHQSLFVIDGSLNGRIIGLSRKAGVGNQSKFYILLDDGSVYLSEVISESAVSQPVLLGKDILTHGIYGFGKLAGDALYWLNGNDIDVSRDGGHTWQTDSAGLNGNVVVDFALDADQTVYAIASGNVYKQGPLSNTWHLTSFPNGSSPTSLFVAKNNRIIAGTSFLGIYYSSDTGHTWLHITNGLNGVEGGKFCQDVFGNIYMLNQSGSEIYRSNDEGINWSRIDSAITNLANDVAFTTIINDIAADSVVCAATIYGLFVSVNQGLTWVPVNNGLHETRLNGFLKSPSGRLLETSKNGFFNKNSTDSTFTKVLPATGYGYAGPLFQDALGNTYTRANASIANATRLILKSADFGNNWQADTSGLWQITNETAFDVDEFGYEHIADNVSNDQTVIYNKIPGGSFLPDTGGIGTSLGAFKRVNTFASDGSGNIYLAGNMSPSCWKRLNSGGNWAPDTTGLPTGTILQFLTHDGHHNMIANALLPAPALYFRQGGNWGTIPFPSSLTGYVEVAAVAADNTNGIIVAFNSYTPVTNNVVGLGIYCTHNLGSSWHLVGFTGPAVYSLVPIGDTIYTLSNRGVYALTCNGVLNDPTVTGLQEIVSNENGELKIFPNPSLGLCHAMFTPVNFKSEFLIVDVTGRTVKTYTASAGIGEITFSTAEFTRGIYFCLLRNSEKTIAARKLVVE